MQLTLEALESAAPGSGSVAYGDTTVELMKITVERNLVILWLVRGDADKFADLEAGDSIVVTFTSGITEFRFTSRATVRGIGQPVVFPHGTMFVQIALDMPQHILERKQRRRRTHSTEPQTLHRGWLLGAVVALVLILLGIVAILVVLMLGIRIV